MSEAIITTLISSGLLLVGTILTVTISARNTRSELRKDFEVHKAEIAGQMALIDTRINTLSERVEAHNKVIERVYALERQVAVLNAKDGE